MSLQKAHCHERGRTLRVHSSEHAGSRGEVVCGPVDKVTAVALLGLVSTKLELDGLHIVGMSEHRSAWLMRSTGTKTNRGSCLEG
jgi:hypothetical protein